MNIRTDPLTPEEVEQLLNMKPVWVNGDNTPTVTVIGDGELMRKAVDKLADDEVFGTSLLQYRTARAIYSTAEMWYITGKKTFTTKELVEAIKNDFPQIAAPERGYAYPYSVLSTTAGRVLRKLIHEGIIEKISNTRYKISGKLTEELDEIIPVISTI